MSADHRQGPRLALALILGGLVFAGGAVLARHGLGEWRSLAVDKPTIRRSFGALARQAGIQLAPGRSRPRLETITSEAAFGGEAKSRGELSAEHAAALTARIVIERSGTLPGDAATHDLAIRFAWDGAPLAVSWEGNPWVAFGAIAAPPVASRGDMDRFSRLLLRPGESFGAPLETTISSYPLIAYPVVRAGAGQRDGAGEREHIVAFSPPGGTIAVSRRGGGSEWAPVNSSRFTAIGQLGPLAPLLVYVPCVLLLFGTLVARGRIDVMNAAYLATAAFLVSAPSFLSGGPTLQGAAWTLVGALVQALWILLLWSAGESYLRSTEPGFTTSLDALRAGRLGPRGGRSLLLGLATGAALSGLALAGLAGAALSSALWPRNTSVPLPIFTSLSSPLGNGIRLAGGIVLLLGLARHLVPKRWVAPLAALAGAVFLAPLSLHPYALEVAGNFCLIGALVVLARRSGLTALLTAAVAYYLLPAAAVSALHVAWLPASCACTAGGVAALLVFGIAGTRRPPQVDLERLAQPAFMRRLGEERRIKYEMDLLSRMQVGLLPQVPSIAGWQIAARSLLATEASGDLYDFLRDEAGMLWIAAGDVAGHGYSCSIVQAMTSAALTSLVSPGRTPSQVLLEIDRVLRRGSGGHRHFTSLALLRLDPVTGEALLANAGHPFPFFLRLAGGEIAEVGLPGLPLGQGPPRRYQDEPLRLQPGSLLVFCSDGLFEAADWKQEPYGYDRPREVLEKVREGSAADVVEALLADWRRHLRSEAPPDDTTIVAIKRLAAVAADGDGGGGSPAPPRRLTGGAARS